ncbi:phosphorothioated DNA-binding restriction endonuclease [Bacillus salacetis]|uniref:phosphorothioated DNA-binding restriction endonuclease n=1 Tax=Bacillus salacetis TaxID=2315464 RepID=UPI003B9FA114
MKAILDEFLIQIDLINVNINGGKPALKKPLCLLLLISKFEHQLIKENKIRFTDIEKELGELIITFGGRPNKSGPKANQPFQYMNSSKFWKLILPSGVEMTHKRDLSIKILRDQETFVQLDGEIFEMLKTSKEFRAIAADFIVKKWWPETIQEEIISTLSLPIYMPFSFKPQRNKEFAEIVLSNFRYRCAICGFNATFNKHHFGLDGAHIKWFSQNGPDHIKNGLALCKIHHWAFDKGAMSISPDKFTIEVSPLFIGRDSKSIEIIESFNGREIFPFKEETPDEKYLKWHQDFIFLQQN